MLDAEQCGQRGVQGHTSLYDSPAKLQRMAG
jgi:hypothetical protein